MGCQRRVLVRPLSHNIRMAERGTMPYTLSLGLQRNFEVVLQPPCMKLRTRLDWTGWQASISAIVHRSGSASDLMAVCRPVFPHDEPTALDYAARHYARNSPTWRSSMSLVLFQLLWSKRPWSVLHRLQSVPYIRRPVEYNSLAALRAK
jgi:hypothetical protein